MQLVMPWLGAPFRALAIGRRGCSYVYTITKRRDAFVKKRMVVALSPIGFNGGANA